jgi:hypothetical protein
VAEYYRQALSNAYEQLSELTDSDKEKIIAITKESGLAEYILDEKQGNSLGLDDLEEYLVDSEGMSDIETFFNAMSGWLNSEEDAKKLFEKHHFDYKPGHLYEVSIPEDNELLDWDKPLSEQPEKVKTALFALHTEYVAREGVEGTFYLPEDTTGEQAYSEISKVLDSREAASRYLNSLGIKGIRYLDGLSRTKGEGTYNYVIFDDSAVEITNTFFQDNSDLLEEAAGYDTWEEFRDAYEEGNPAPADDAWYKTFWQDARIAAGMETETQFQSGSEIADEAFLNDIDRETVQEAVREIWNKYAAQMTEPLEGEDRGEYDLTRGLKARMERGELPDREAWLIVAAKMSDGRELSKDDYTRLRSLIREAPRDYRALFADLLDRPEWGMDLADMKDGEPNARLADPVRGGEEAFKQERLARIADDIGDPELAVGIREGTITFDDPRIQALSKTLEEDDRRGQEALEQQEEETRKDYAALANLGGKQLAELYQRFVDAKDKITDRRLNAERKRKAGELLTEKYQRDSRVLEADYDDVYRTLIEAGQAAELSAEVREAIARTEARTTEMIRQRALRLRRRAVSELKRIKQGLVKRTMRKVSFATVAYTEAKAIKIVQTFFEPSLIAGIHKWVGGLQGPALRKIWDKWHDENTDFRDDLTRADKSRKIQQILDKEWDFITKSEKGDLIRLLPKKDWIAELNLEAFIEDLNNSIQLDTKEIRGADGNTYVVLGEEEDRIAREALGEELYARIQSKPFADWTVLEMAELAEVVDDLYNEGRINKRAVEEARLQQRNRYQSLMQNALRLTKIQINDDDTPEEKERKHAQINKILNKYNTGIQTEAQKSKVKTLLFNINNGYHYDANIRRVARLLDGHKDGIFTNLLYWQENDAFNKRERAIIDRNIRVSASMKSLGITLNELTQSFKFENFRNDGVDQYFSVDDFLGMKLAERDELSRRAVVYGNMMKEGERSQYKINPTAAVEQWLTDTAEGRFAKVMAVADEFFAREGNGKFLTFMETISKDYDETFIRLNQANIDVFNEPVFKVEHYFPMYRLEATGDPNNHQVINDLLGAAGVSTQWTDKGMTQKRIDMSPASQTGIELGLYSTWGKSVQKVEHFISYAPYVQSLNAVFKSRSGKALEESTTSRWGKGMTNYINEYINEVANPQSLRQHDTLNNLVRAMRGKTAAAYLGWKVSSVLKQAVTSPWPYLQYMNPAEYIGSLVKFLSDPKAMTEYIKSKSVFMYTRQADPMYQLIREQQEAADNKAKGFLNSFNKAGMMGLEGIDWIAVAPGWLAVYERESARLTREGKLGASLVEEEAVRLADDVVRKSQPSSRTTDMAPMFKRGNEVTRALLQFQQALNVIWQDLRYGIPDAIANRQIGQLVGKVTGYVLAGIGLGLLTQGTFGNDEDDEEGKRWRKFVYWSFTQGTDSVPILGDLVTRLAEGAITGKWERRYDTNLFPVATDFLEALEAGIKSGQYLSEGESEKAGQQAKKAAGEFASMFGMAFGIPLSALKEAGRFTGIGDKEEGLDFNPGALMGRRKKK